MYEYILFSWILHAETGFAALVNLKLLQFILYNYSVKLQNKTTYKRWGA